jgi:hypothetical protein
MERDEEGLENIAGGESDFPEGGLSGVPPLDVGKWRPYLDDFDITEEQKAEIIRILWNMMITFVDLGFGQESVQRIFPAIAAISSMDGEGAVKWEDCELVREFIQNTDLRPEGAKDSRDGD